MRRLVLQTALAALAQTTGNVAVVCGNLNEEVHTLKIYKYSDISLSLYKEDKHTYNRKDGWYQKLNSKKRFQR